MILFISDLHLDADRPDVTQAFLRFLDDRAVHAQALYILGDLFEVWIGDDGMDSYQHQIAQALSRLAQKGTHVFLMHGNRDFMLGKTFCQEAQCQLLSDPSLIHIQGSPVLLMHGDTLCTQDRSYQRKRWKLRNPISRWLLGHLPLSVRHTLAQKLRAASQRYTQEQPTALTDVTHEAVCQIMRRYQVQTLIHGHTHRPAVHSLEVNNTPAQRWVLGDWDKQAWVLIADQDDIRLESFPLNAIATTQPLHCETEIPDQALRLPDAQSQQTH